MTGHKDDRHIASGRLARDPIEAFLHIVQRRLLIAQHLGYDLAVNPALLCLERRRHIAGVGRGEGQHQSGILIAADPNRQDIEPRLAQVGLDHALPY